MTILPILMTKIKKDFIRYFRESTYDDMARQASDWIPEEIRVETVVCESQPITLDFAVPKKNRLAWVSRTIQQLPH